MVINKILRRCLVSVKKSQVYDILKKHRDHLPIIGDWGNSGQPKLLQDDDVDQLTIAMSKERGNTFRSAELRSTMITIAEHKIRQLGYVPLS